MANELKPVPGTDIKLYDQVVWNRSTVADGNRLQAETLVPISANDRILASAIQGAYDYTDECFNALSADFVEFQDEVDNEFQETYQYINNVSGDLYNDIRTTESNLSGALQDEINNRIAQDDDLAAQIEMTQTTLHNEITGASADLHEEITTASAELQDEIDALEAATDVVDVIDTLDDLDDYDKKITKDDIIKILDAWGTYDSSGLSAYNFSGEQVYVRYNGKTTAHPLSANWDYVGKLEPYYNTSYIDAMYNSIEASALDLYNTIDETSSTLIDTIHEVSSSLETTITNSANYLSGLISDTSAILHDEITSTSADLYDIIEDTSSTLHDEISSVSSTLHDEISSTSADLYDIIEDTSADLYDIISSTSSTLYDEISSTSADLFDIISSTSSILNDDIQYVSAHTKKTTVVGGDYITVDEFVDSETNEYTYLVDLDTLSGASGFVRADIEQDFEPSAQKQARQNIGILEGDKVWAHWTNENPSLTYVPGSSSAEITLSNLSCSLKEGELVPDDWDTPRLPAGLYHYDCEICMFVEHPYPAYSRYDVTFKYADQSLRSQSVLFDLSINHQNGKFAQTYMLGGVFKMPAEGDLNITIKNMTTVSGTSSQKMKWGNLYVHKIG